MLCSAKGTRVEASVEDYRCPSVIEATPFVVSAILKKRRTRCAGHPENSGLLPGQGHTRAIPCGVRMFLPQSSMFNTQKERQEALAKT